MLLLARASTTVHVTLRDLGLDVVQLSRSSLIDIVFLGVGEHVRVRPRENQRGVIIVGPPHDVRRSSVIGTDLGDESP